VGDGAMSRKLPPDWFDRCHRMVVGCHEKRRLNANERHRRRTLLLGLRLAVDEETPTGAQVGAREMLREEWGITVPMARAYLAFHNTKSRKRLRERV